MLPFLPLMPVVSAVHSLTPFKLYAGARAAVTGVEVSPFRSHSQTRAFRSCQSSPSSSQVALSNSSTPYLFSSPTPTLLDRSLASAFSAARWLPLPHLLVADFTATQFPSLSAHAEAVAASRKKRPLDRLARLWGGWTTGAEAGWARVAAGVGLGVARGVAGVVQGWARGRGIVKTEAKKLRKKKRPPPPKKRGVSAWF